jgi:glycerophosphoryl diester phosphodiesterase
MKRLGYPVWVWTVNEPKRMERMLTLGVDAIITDRPDLALGLQQRLASS